VEFNVGAGLVPALFFWATAARLGSPQARVIPTIVMIIIENYSVSIDRTF